MTRTEGPAPGYHPPAFALYEAVFGEGECGGGCADGTGW